jgi:hypothetical protein
VVLRAICVGRHPFLSEHLARFFGRFGLETVAAVGLEAAARLAVAAPPDLLLCEFDLLTAGALASWEGQPGLGAVSVIGVSLTRRPEEAPLLDAHGVAGFLYLPTLRAEDARRVLRPAAPPPGYSLPRVFDAIDRAPAAPPR